MKEPYIEGVATRDGREPCVDDPEGRGEASVAVRAGRAIEPRNHGNRGADVVSMTEDNIVGSVTCELLADPAWDRGATTSGHTSPACVVSRWLTVARRC